MKGSDIHTILIPTGLVGKTNIPHRTARKNRTVKSHVPDLQYVLRGMYACMYVVSRTTVLCVPGTTVLQLYCYRVQHGLAVGTRRKYDY